MPNLTGRTLDSLVEAREYFSSILPALEENGPNDRRKIVRQNLADLDAELERRAPTLLPQAATAAPVPATAPLASRDEPLAEVDPFAAIGKAAFERMNAKREPATAGAPTPVVTNKPVPTAEDVYGDAAVADVYARLNARHSSRSVDGDLEELADRLTPAT